jgi:hypothetical protein
MCLYITSNHTHHHHSFTDLPLWPLGCPAATDELKDRTKAGRRLRAKCELKYIGRTMALVLGDVNKSCPSWCAGRKSRSVLAPACLHHTNALRAQIAADIGRNSITTT